MQGFDLNNLDRYCADYSQLGEALGLAEAKPAPGEVEFLRAVTTPGRFDFGMLSPPEIFFAAGVTSILGPRMAGNWDCFRFLGRDYREDDGATPGRIGE